MSDRSREEAIRSLVSELATVVTGRGFVPAPERVLTTKGWKTDEAAFRRSHDWKLDEIDVVVGRAGRWNVDVQFYVWLPTPRNGETRFAFVNVGYLAGEKSGGFELPWLGVGSARFAKRVLSEIESQLTWFDRFASPEDCLTELAGGIGGLVAGSPAEVRCRKFLARKSK